MSKEHTPTPWEMDEYFNEITVRDANKDYVFSVRLTMDAQKKRDSVKRIIKDVNNHDKLVGTLSRIVEAQENPECTLHYLNLLIRNASDFLTELKS